MTEKINIPQNTQTDVQGGNDQMVEYSPNDVPTKRNRTKMQDILDGYGPNSMTQ